MARYHYSSFERWLSRGRSKKRPRVYHKNFTKKDMSALYKNINRRSKLSRDDFPSRVFDDFD